MTPDRTIRSVAELAVRDGWVHLVEEHARHCGHSDLLRGCVYGRTGR